MADRVANLLAFGSLAPEEPPRDGLARMQFPSWYTSGASFGTLVPQFPEPPPSRQDQAFNTSIDRWKQLAKDVFFAPADALKAFNEKPTFANSLGIMPMGTFGGPLAKTADRAALSTAEMLAGKGASREAIWDKTGWFRGPDEKWRFEIPDNASTWNLPAKLEPGENIKVKSSEALTHPDLTAAYPETANLPVQYVRPRDPVPGAALGLYAGPERGYAIREAGPFGDPRGIALHELQHHVQGQEGFARGANPRQIPLSMVNEERARLVAQGANRPLTMEGFVQDIYRRHAGEVESRAVESRMNLTPEQRRARYPWLDYDVPIEQQIVK